MFNKLKTALFQKVERPTRWQAPDYMFNSEARRRHVDDEAAFRAHLMRHTNYR